MTASDKLRYWAVLSRKSVYRGFYQMDTVEFQHQLFAGGHTGTIKREMFVRGNVAGLLAYDPAADCVALIEQFRIGAVNLGPDPWLFEIIAGMIDTDDSPEQTAIREAREEAGLNIESAELVSHYLASPGVSTEEVFIYYAETDLQDVGGLHGLAAEGEDIRVSVVPAEEAFEMVKSRKIKNALSVIALQWLQLKRAGLA